MLLRYLRTDNSEKYTLEVSKKKLFYAVYNMHAPKNRERELLEDVYSLMRDAYFCGAVDGSVYCGIKEYSSDYITMCEYEDYYKKNIYNNQVALLYIEYCKFKDKLEEDA